MKKKEILRNRVSLDLVLENLKKDINLDNFHYSQDDKHHYWKIAPIMLENNLADFLAAQFQLYQQEDDQHMQEAVNRIREAKNGQEMLELAANHHLIRFQLVNYISDYIEVIRDNVWNESIEVAYQLMAFFLDGKIIMECYGNILRYLEKNIRLQKTKYPIAEYVKVMISG